MAVLLPAAAAVFCVYVGTVFIQTYGLTLFVLTPFLIGFGSAVIQKPTNVREFGICLLANLLSIVLIGVLLMAFAIEGAVCLVMALPLILPIDAVGVLIGCALLSIVRRPAPLPIIWLFSIASMPFILGFEASHRSEPTLHKIVSTVKVDAPIETVWKNVVEFPQIDKQPEGILSLGFAYPINATIDGTGIGAVRRCNFNTGAFVEPITAWDEPHLLAFDVKEQPAPMIELSPYNDLHAAHLEYLRSQKGQFRLFEKDGKTVLEGTTYYTHDIAPDFYWRLFSDEIIHRIHLRVLEHIKAVSEGRRE